MPKPNQSFFVFHIQSKAKILTDKERFNEKEWTIEKKRKEAF